MRKTLRRERGFGPLKTDDKIEIDSALMKISQRMFYGNMLVV